MKRKKLFIILSVLLVIAITVVVAITQLPKWSRLSFEAVVQETVIQPDGEVGGMGRSFPVCSGSL